MSLRQKYLNVLTAIVPAGAVGVSLLLGSTAPSAASQDPATPQAAAKPAVSERLAAIRDAVSTLATPEQLANGERKLAWGNWWGRPWGGWGWPNWNNWRNWNNWGNWWHNW